MSDRTALTSLTAAVLADEGIQYRVSGADRRGAEAAAELMNDVIAAALSATGVNADGRVDAADVAALSAHIRADADLYADFLDGHGDDEGAKETGFHLVQGDGGTSLFQGRRFVDTVADAIYHIGFRIVDGRFQNEDGDANETVADVAGWLNWFLNGESAVYGTNGSDDLHSGVYSVSLAGGEAELFLAGAGDDTVRGGFGDDTVQGGTGDDRVSGEAGDYRLHGEAGADTLSGGAGRDRMVGGTGDDTLWGDEGRDRMSGGGGADRMGGGTGDDRMRGGGGDDTLAGEGGDDDMRGGGGRDTLWSGDGDDRVLGGGGADRLGGGDGADALSGGAGDDSLTGDAGDDVLQGGKGADTLLGGEGTDRIVGGTGADILLDWEDAEAPDMFVFATGDSGLGAQADIVRGFDSGRDWLDLRGYGDLEFDGARLSGAGPSVAFDDRVLSIDVDGDGAADEAIVLEWLSTLVRTDLILSGGDF